MIYNFDTIAPPALSSNSLSFVQRVWLFKPLESWAKWTYTGLFNHLPSLLQHMNSYVPVTECDNPFTLIRLSAHPVSRSNATLMPFYLLHDNLYCYIMMKSNNMCKSKLTIYRKSGLCEHLVHLPPSQQSSAW